MSNSKKFKSWLKKRPRVIRELGEKYPPGRYRMKEGCPYAITCEGTMVTLLSYNENGEVTVAVMAEDKLPSAIEHEKQLHIRYGTPPAHDKNISIQVDPQWIELVESYV